MPGKLTERVEEAKQKTACVLVSINSNIHNTTSRQL